MPSSVILGMRYMPEAQVLVIVYRGGRGMYRYCDVPMEEWTAFRTSGSKGTYLNEVFKAKNYPYEKLAGAPSRSLVIKDEQRNADENDQAKQQPEFLEWGEAWAFPKPRPQRGNAHDR